MPKSLIRNIINYFSANHKESSTALSTKLKSIQDEVNEIINSLKVDTAKYKECDTIESIRKYLNISNNFIYYGVSTSLSDLSPKEKSAIRRNLSKLLDYSLTNNNISDDVRDIVIKLSDTFYTEINQYVRADNIIKDSINKVAAEAEKRFQSSFKELERQHVAILGILATIIITFISGITFSTSVLENLHKANAYRLILITLIIGFVFINTTYVMFVCLHSIVNKNDEVSSWMKDAFKFTNGLLIIMMIVTIFAWKCKWIEKRNNEDNEIEIIETVMNENDSSQ